MAHEHEAPEPVDYRSVVAAESARFAEILDAGPLDAPIAGCPGWSLHDLGVHLGGVQRWATTIIATGQPGEGDLEVGDQPLASWFREGTAALLDAIDGSDPEAECWNLWKTGERKVRFWYRRQALEVAVHRWDAESAVSDTPAPIDAAVAADTVDEWVHVILARNLERAGVDLATLDGDAHFHCTDTPGEWTLDVIDGAIVASNEHRKSAVAARGPAHDLALLAYGRTAAAVDVFGDTDLLDRWLGR